MAVPAFSKLAPEYVRQWGRMKIRPERLPIINRIAARILANKKQYVAIQTKLGVPWFFVACIHDRESGGNFKRHLHNGDPLTARTRLVPAGRPKTGKPPFTWVESATDALKMKNLDKVADWSLARFAYEGERYNGWGYRNKGVPSAYLWSYSTIYEGGKYIADHVWSSTAQDAQSGIMPLLKRLMELDASVTFDAAEPMDIPIAPPVVVRPEPEPVDPFNRDEPYIEPVPVVAPPVEAPVDLPMTPSEPAPFDPGPVRGDDDVWNVQRRLRARGYPPGDLDGLWGKRSRDMLSSFLSDRKSTITHPTEELETFRVAHAAIKDELARAESENFTRPVAVARATATADELAPKLPEVAAAKTAERVTFWGAVSGFFVWVTSLITAYVGDAISWLGQLRKAAGDIPSGYIFAGAAVVLIIVYIASLYSGAAKNASKQAYNAGERS